MQVKIEQTWANALQEEFGKPYFASMVRFLHEQKAAGKVIYPPGPAIFRAFDLTPADKVKVVIIGQDPYHGPGQAMGLSFSVPEGVSAPPSLKNIFKEIESDLDVRMSGRTDLSSWARQGVLLLNASLTVEAGLPNSHGKIGWTVFTDAVISWLSSHREGLVFLLWGSYAKSKKELIDASRHLVLEAAHPSPLARGAFFGCRHFSKTNNYLTSRGLSPIDWQI